MLKRNVVLWMMLGSLLLTPMAGCQREESTVTDSSAMAVVSEDSSLPEEASSLEPVSSAEPISSKDTSSEAPSVSSKAENSQISSEAIISSSEPTSSYSYSSKASQIKEVDPSDPPKIITVQFTAQASDPNKKYSDEDFPGCDITVIDQGQYGGNSIIYPDGIPNPDDPVLVYLKLQINQSGFENYEKVIQYFDQREDIAVIGQTVFEIPD